MTKASDNIFPKVTFVEGAAPSSPAASDFHLYFDSSDHLLKWKNSAGTVTTIATGTGLSDPMTTRGDIIVRNSSNATARLAVGSAGKFLSSDGTDVSWGNGPMTTKGDVIVGGTSGAPARLAVGSDTQVLTADSASTNGVKWAAAGSGGGWPMLEAHTASSSASLDFTSCISSTYDDYLVEFIGIRPATNTVTFEIRMGAGSFDSGTNYKRTGWFNGTPDTLTNYNATGQTAIAIAGSVTNDASQLKLNGTLRLYDPQTTGGYKHTIGSVVSMAGAGNVYRWDTAGAWISTSAVDRFQFLFSSGNIAEGTIRVYGIPKS